MNAVKAYRISNWESIFEKSQSKRAKTHHWVAMPIKHDGAGFRRITIQPNATDLFSAWCLIVQVAAKCPIRGLLVDLDGVPIDSESMAIKTGFPVSIFDSAFDFFISDKMKWIVFDSERKAKHSEQAPSEKQNTPSAQSKSQLTPSETKKTPSENTHSTVQYNTDNNSTNRADSVAADLLKKYPEYSMIAECYPLSEIKIERYAQIIKAFPKIKRERFADEIAKICLAATDPKTEITTADGWFRMKIGYASERIEKENGGKVMIEDLEKRGVVICR